MTGVTRETTEHPSGKHRRGSSIGPRHHLPRRRSLRAVAVALVGAVLAGAGVVGGLAVVAGPASAASAVEAYPVPGSGTFQLSGLGYGHGIGMSQFGAEGMGRLGKTYREIVKFYYPGTHLAEVSAKRQITVGLSGIVRSTPQGSGVVRPRPQRLVDSATRATPSHCLAVSGASRSRSSASSGAAEGSRSGRSSPAKATKVKGGMNGSVRWRTAAAVDRSRVAVQSASGTTRVYRGFLEVAPGSTSVLAVNRLLLEHYLRSVVSSEVPSSWTDAALRAQAVAARSYALLAQVNSRAAHRAYDICDTTSCQVYSPISGETAPEVAAVKATAHQYLKDAGQPVFAMFSSANGGYSVSGQSALSRRQARPVRRRRDRNGQLGPQLDDLGECDQDRERLATDREPAEAEGARPRRQRPVGRSRALGGPGRQQEHDQRLGRQLPLGRWAQEHLVDRHQRRQQCHRTGQERQGRPW